MSATTTTAERPAPEARWLTPGVRGIGGASLLADVGHEIPTSLLTGTLGAPAAALGIIEGSPAASPAPHDSPAAPSPTTRNDAARSPSAATAPPPCRPG